MSYWLNKIRIEPAINNYENKNKQKKRKGSKKAAFENSFMNGQLKLCSW